MLNKDVILKLTSDFHIKSRYSFSLHRMSKFKLRNVGLFVELALLVLSLHFSKFRRRAQHNICAMHVEQFIRSYTKPLDESKRYIAVLYERKPPKICTRRIISSQMNFTIVEGQAQFIS